MAYGIKLLSVCECLNGASIDFKFGTSTINYRPTYCIDFKFRIHSFFTGVQEKNSYTLQRMEPNYKKHANV